MKPQTKQPDLSWNSPMIKNLAFWIMILVVISLCMYLIVQVRNESMRCIAAPLVYGVGHLSSNTNSQITCSCSIPGTDQILYVTKSNMTVIRTGLIPVNNLWNQG